MELKKEELYATLVLIASQRKVGDVVTDQGLLNEKITLGLKRKAQKIMKTLAPLYEEYEKDLKVCDGDEKEIKELNEEIVKLDCEPLSLEMIENIETSTNYNWDLIEKICR